MTCDLSLITSTEVSEELFASSSDDELETMNSMYHHCQVVVHLCWCRSLVGASATAEGQLAL